MAHHKRKRPKHQRGGCLYCKSYKDERVKGASDSPPVPVRRKLQGPAFDQCPAVSEYGAMQCEKPDGHEDAHFAHLPGHIQNSVGWFTDDLGIAHEDVWEVAVIDD